MTPNAVQITAETRNPESPVPRYDLESWLGEYGIMAGITGADGGFDLGLWGEQPAGRVMDRWHGLLSSFGGRFRKVVLGRQVHGSTVEACDGRGSGILIKEGIDGHSTMTPGVLLVVLVADCIPVYMLDLDTNAVALLHAGWRGTAAGVLSAGLEKLKSFGTGDGKNVLMHCGIGICGDCYEVGPEVAIATRGRHDLGGGKLDLRGVLAEQASTLGIGQVTRSSWCTLHDGGLFHSYRGSGQAAGRMAAYLGVPLA